MIRRGPMPPPGPDSRKGEVNSSRKDLSRLPGSRRLAAKSGRTPKAVRIQKSHMPNQAASDSRKFTKRPPRCHKSLSASGSHESLEADPGNTAPPQGVTKRPSAGWLQSTVADQPKAEMAAAKLTFLVTDAKPVVKSLKAAAGRRTLCGQ